MTRSTLTVVAALAVTAAVVRAEPEHLLATAGAGATSGEATATPIAGVELELAGLALSVRGDLGDRRATALVGIAPGRVEEPGAWTPRCSVGTSPATCRSAPASRARAGALAHNLVPFAGVRRDEARTSVVLAARLYPSRDSLGDHVELAMTGVVAGRDREFVQHAHYMPGWYLAAAWRVGPILVGGEVGATGLQTREMAGRVDPEMFALATIGVAVSR